MVGTHFKKNEKCADMLNSMLLKVDVIKKGGAYLTKYYITCTKFYLFFLLNRRMGYV